MKQSIKNLDLHRKGNLLLSTHHTELILITIFFLLLFIEALEMRRASRNSRLDDSVDQSLDSVELRSNNATDAIKDIKELLGPLPPIPDLSRCWSRRISGASGIYEEILDKSDLDALQSKYKLHFIHNNQ